MREYKKAGAYADSCIKIFEGNLLDYNLIDSSRTYPITAFNMEVIFYDVATTAGSLNSTMAKVDSNLYATYRENDLRRILFFKPNNDGTVSFRGSYTGKSSYFIGIALDEIYLIRSECQARLGNVDQAMEDLNALLLKRYKSGTFEELTASNKQEAITYILTERRKELLLRDLRWMDIKRLNKEGADISLQRVIGEQHFMLNAGSSGFALPLPIDVVTLTGMQQNPK
jgi:hypothetical protein